MQKLLLQYFGTTTLEVTKTLVMTYLLMAMAVPTVYAYSYNLKLAPESPDGAHQTKSLGLNSSFDVFRVVPEKTPFSIHNIVELTKQDKTHMIWFTYPASVRGQVFFGQTVGTSPLSSFGSGGW